jgi:AraC-like DNA-binding protein
MNKETLVSTEEVAEGRRDLLIRETAFEVFNLEVAFDARAAADLFADIRIVRGANASLVDVRTSGSHVERSPARARAARSDNFLVYLVRGGSNAFRNEHGEEFMTAAGTVVIGAQDHQYQASAQGSGDWNFSALSVPASLFPLSGANIRGRGFRPITTGSPLGNLLGGYVQQLCEEFRELDGISADASLRSLDHLVAAALSPGVSSELVAHTLAERRFARGLRFLDKAASQASLTPDDVARHLAVSARQLHRDFEMQGTSVSGEIRKVRLRNARDLLLADSRMPVTRVALACGFDSLSTFHRCFREAYGVTASELRASTARP